MKVNENVRHFPADRAYGYNDAVGGNIIVEDEHSSDSTIDNAVNIDKGGDSMDNDKILEKYMDMINQDRRDMEHRLTEDRRDMEKRLMEDRREGEARSEERFTRLEKKIDTLSNKIDSHRSFLWGVIITAFIGVGGFVWALVQVVAALK